MVKDSTHGLVSIMSDDYDAAALSAEEAYELGVDVTAHRYDYEYWDRGCEDNVNSLVSRFIEYWRKHE